MPYIYTALATVSVYLLWANTYQEWIVMSLAAQVLTLGVFAFCAVAAIISGLDSYEASK